ncbi:MAG: hypothetical protein C0459_00440 [Chitinophaga sp.]|jgi:predicted nucleotidyltransferase|nr:hypothetical protein [Chitinophaga sp.]
MDIYNEEFISFWKSLNKHRVKFIMVGGVATNLNGYQRTTDDIDVWIDDNFENRNNLRRALKEYSEIDYFMLVDMRLFRVGRILI